MAVTKADPVSHRLAERLRKELQGEVLFDRFTRGRYSTDASHYQIEPVGVVVPRTDDDVRAAMAIAREEGVPLLPRGGGTSQSGQTVGRALVHGLQQAPEPAGRDQRDRRAPASSSPASCSTSSTASCSRPGLWFPVDVSTASRATIGGMAGNNSCGTRSIRYGIMRDNVLAIDAILADGSEARFGEVGHNLAPLAPDGGLPLRGRDGVDHSSPRRGSDAGGRSRTPASALFRDLLALGRREAEHIAHAFPEVTRRVGGYLIDALVPGARAGQSRHAAVRLGGHARRLAAHRAEAVAAAEEQGARHLPLRHLPQGHGGDPAHRQARPRGGRGGRPHADRARARHRHVPPGDGDLRARPAGRAAAGRVRRGRPGREPAPPRPARRADGRSRPSRAAS